MTDIITFLDDLIGFQGLQFLKPIIGIVCLLLAVELLFTFIYSLFSNSWR